MKLIKSSALLIAVVVMVASCDQPAEAPSPEAAPVSKLAEVAPVQDELTGMWQLESDVWQCSMDKCQATGTILVTMKNADGVYQGTMNIETTRYNLYAPPGSENPMVIGSSGAEQSCTILKTGISVAIQCTVDRSRFPDWSADSFRLEAGPNMNEYTGRFIGGVGAGVRFWKIS